jgi:hypothetical protein
MIDARKEKLRGRERRYSNPPIASLRSGARRGSTLGTRAENFHRAFQQVLKFAAFDPWASSSNAGAFRDYHGIFFDGLKIATI